MRHTSTQVRRVGDVVVVYRPDEEGTADLIAGVCEGAIRLAVTDWGLEPPENCRIHVMTAPVRFVFESAPWPWRVLLAASLPGWLPRVRRLWPYSAAWTQRYGRRVAIGVKPPRLVAQADRSIGARIYIEEPDPQVKVQHVACHELVHACSARLGLPMWLNEGLAMVSVDRYLGKPTISPASLRLVREHAPKTAPPSYRTLARLGAEAIAYQTVRGYWLVRYLEAVHAGVLKRAFAGHRNGLAVERAVLAELGLAPADVWTSVDDLVTGYFSDTTGGGRGRAPRDRDAAGGSAA